MSGSKRKLKVLYNNDPTPERVVVDPGITVGALATMLKKRNKLNDDCAVKLEACSASERIELNLNREEDGIEDYIGEDESVLMSWTKAAVSQEPQARAHAYTPAHVSQVQADASAARRQILGAGSSCNADANVNTDTASETWVAHELIVTPAQANSATASGKAPASQHATGVAQTPPLFDGPVQQNPSPSLSAGHCDGVASAPTLPNRPMHAQEAAGDGHTMAASATIDGMPHAIDATLTSTAPPPNPSLVPTYVDVEEAMGLASIGQERFKLHGSHKAASTKAYRVGHVVMTATTDDGYMPTHGSLKVECLADLAELVASGAVTLRKGDTLDDPALLQALTQLANSHNVWESPLVVSVLKPLELTPGQDSKLCCHLYFTHNVYDLKVCAPRPSLCHAPPPPCPPSFRFFGDATPIHITVWCSTTPPVLHSAARHHPPALRSRKKAPDVVIWCWVQKTSRIQTANLVPMCFRLCLECAGRRGPRDSSFQADPMRHRYLRQRVVRVRGWGQPTKHMRIEPQSYRCHNRRHPRGCRQHEVCLTAVGSMRRV